MLNKGDYKGNVIYLLNTIRKNISIVKLGKLMRRIYKVALYREVKSAAFADLTIKDRMLEKHVLYYFRYYYNLSKQYFIVLYGYAGIPTLLPLDSINKLCIRLHKDF